MWQLDVAGSQASVGEFVVSVSGHPGHYVKRTRPLLVAFVIDPLLSFTEVYR